MPQISNADAAKRTLVEYFRKLSGPEFTDNDRANIEFCVEQIIAAAVNEAVATTIRRIRTAASWIED